MPYLFFFFSFLRPIDFIALKTPTPFTAFQIGQTIDFAGNTLGICAIRLLIDYRTPIISLSMVNAFKGLLISCDIPMAVFIINMNNGLPQSQKFIIHVLDSTHIFVRPDVAGMIRSAIADFREANTYEKPGS